MEELSLNARRRIYRAVCYLAHADEVLGAGERALLVGLQEKLSLGEDEARALEAEGKRGDSIRLKPDSNEGVYAVRALVLVMLADDVLHPEEAKRLKRIAQRVGVDEEQLTKILRVAMIKRNQRRSRAEDG